MNRFQRYLPALLVCLLLNSRVYAQSHIQHIRIQNHVLRWNLENFVRQSKARWVKIIVEQDSVDQGYVYRLYTLHQYETVRAYDGDIWGEWQHTILLFYDCGNVDLGDIYQLSDTTDLLQVQQYARLGLPRSAVHAAVPVVRAAPSPRRGLPRRVSHVNLSYPENKDRVRNLVYTFKVVKGKEMYFFDNVDETTTWIDLTQFPPVPEYN